MAKAKKSATQTKAKAKAKAKKKPNAPLMPVKPRKAKATPTQTPGQIARSARIQAIRQRTTASLQQIDELAAGADLDDLAGLKTMIVTGPRRAEASWRHAWAKEPRDRDSDLDVRRKFAKRQSVGPTGLAWHTDRAMLPKPSGRRCKHCKHPEHPFMSCKELVDWMATSAKVFAGELATPAGIVAPRVVPPEGLPDPRPTGRPSRRAQGKRLSLQERSELLFRTDPAAGSCPAPSPSP